MAHLLPTVTERKFGISVSKAAYTEITSLLVAEEERNWMAAARSSMAKAGRKAARSCKAVLPPEKQTSDRDLRISVMGPLPDEEPCGPTCKP